MPLVLVGLSHHTAPVEVRERFAFAEAAIPAALARLRAARLANEAVILSTCNRVEVYAATDLDAQQALAALREFLVGGQGCAQPADRALYALCEPQSLTHLFRVAAGLDSMVLGETEILGQLKQAYALALRHGHTGRCLNKAFQKAFHVAKQLRTQTNIQRGSVSVASVAVDLAERLFDSLAGRRVMVIGAGDTSEKAARALRSRGAEGILVANRSYDRAVALAAGLAGQAVAFDDWAREFPRLDIIISSTAAPGYVLDRRQLEPLMPLRKHRPLLLIDLAVPRDIDPAVNLLEEVYLYNIDDLQTIADEALRQRQEDIAHCEAIIQEKVKALFSPPPTAGARGSNPAYET
jgi:glutamyl-tRNA reductase